MAELEQYFEAFVKEAERERQRGQELSEWSQRVELLMKEAELRSQPSKKKKKKTRKK